MEVSYLYSDQPLNQFFGMQGFTQLHFTPLEVLAIIEGVQKRLDKKFTAEEIEQGILKDVLTEEDYNLTRVVSFIIS